MITLFFDDSLNYLKYNALSSLFLNDYIYRFFLLAMMGIHIIFSISDQLIDQIILMRILFFSDY
jgi:hypothetical protein